MHEVEAYTRVPGLTFALKDLKNAASAILERLSKLGSQRISVRPVSEEWRQRHQRDSVKH